jgi:hypothetical protein
LVDCHLPFVVQVEQRNNEEGGVLWWNFINFGEVGYTLEGLELLDFEGPNINGIDGQRFLYHVEACVIETCWKFGSEILWRGGSEFKWGNEQWWVKYFVKCIFIMIHFNMFRIQFVKWKLVLKYGVFIKNHFSTF